MNLALSTLLVFFVASATAQYQNPYARQIFGTRSTKIVTASSTFTLTCTKSVAACGGGRKRRDVLEEHDTHDQFPISPSAVHGVEPTSSPVRESRAADPQVLLVNPAYGYQLQSGIYNGNYRPYAVPYLDGYAGQQPQIAERFLFWPAITSTSTSFIITTSTVTPGCSAAGPTIQCPNA